jgi:transcriptional regulator with XRE-family HTH domain
MAPVKKPKPILGKHYLKEWRETKGVGQQDAAAAITLSRTMLSKIENMENPYQQQYVEGLARLYRCTPADLIGSDPNAVPRDAGSKLRTSLLAYGVDGADLQQVMDIIETFATGEKPEETPSPADTQPANPRRVKAPSG